MQQRTLKTRARLMEIASALTAEAGYAALRTEDVVAGAGVAKGTFFAHFKDKDTLMDHLIGERIDVLLDAMETAGPCPDVETLVERSLPMLTFMTSERYVFDVILRRSGAAALAEVGPIARTLDRYGQIVSQSLAGGSFRQDIDPGMLVEGVQAFAMQAMALNFCALHNQKAIRDRLLPYLVAWMSPPTIPV